MRRQRRWVHYLLLFIFAFLFIKNLLPAIPNGGEANCGEIGHIHWYKMEARQSEASHQKGHVKSVHEDENCHSGKVLADVFTLSPLNLFVTPFYEIAFDLIATLNSNKPNPYLESWRKPPRPS